MLCVEALGRQKNVKNAHNLGLVSSANMGSGGIALTAINGVLESETSQI